MHAIIVYLRCARNHCLLEVCTRDPHLGEVVFLLELVYGLAITAVPLGVITVFNCLITHKLMTRDKVSGHVRFVQQESRLRLEFTLTLLAVSTCFVCLNIPYFVVWCEQFVQSVNPQVTFFTYLCRPLVVVI